MARLTLLLLLTSTFFISFAQQLEQGRTTDWSRAGAKSNPSPSATEVNILDFGADATGNTPSNEAYSQAVASLNNEAGIVFFPSGEYFFNAGISIPNDVRIEGESTETVLRFNLGGQGSLIHINGNIGSEEFPLSSSIAKGETELTLVNADAFETGDLIRIGCNDEDLMYSSWAYGTLGQVVEVVEKEGNTLHLADPSTRNYVLNEAPYIRKITPVRGAGISCLRVIREDATSSQTSNIFIRNAIDCEVANVESENCNFAHVEVNSSAHITIHGGYFHHAHAYGGGGQGYGVVFQETSSFNLAENNVFEHLRHSMLLQSGATGNVYGYNYSIDPHWISGMLPSNSAGDAVLHGNHPHHNLFEGNVIQNIVVDASHGNSGPFNTFFRNRAELFGFFSDSGTPTDSMNIIGNEITNSGFPYGLFMVNGVGHYQYGNNVFGTITPSSTENMSLPSLYRNSSEAPGFAVGASLPLVGYPNSLDESQLSAQIRMNQQEPISCDDNAIVTSVIESSEDSNLSPYVFGHTLILPSDLVPATVQFYSMQGSLVEEVSTASSTTRLPHFLSSGVYILNCIGSERQENIKVLISP